VRGVVKGNFKISQVLTAVEIKYSCVECDTM